MKNKNNSLFEIFENHDNGLPGYFCLPAQTGIGKSYTCEEYVVEKLNENYKKFVKTCKEENSPTNISCFKMDRIIFVSCDKNNVNDFKNNVLNKVIEKHNENNENISPEDFKKIFGIVLSKSDNIEKLLSKTDKSENPIEILKQLSRKNPRNEDDIFFKKVYESKEYKNFEKAFKQGQSIKAKGKNSPEYQNIIKEFNDMRGDLYMYLENFRRWLKRFIEETYKVDKGIKTKIKDEACFNYMWIRALFPDVNINDKLVLCVNIHKFMYPINPIVDKIFRMYSDDFINNALVLFDESDDLWGKMMEIIIKQSNLSNGDLISGCRTLINTVLTKKLSDDLGVCSNQKSICNKKQQGVNMEYDKLKRMAGEISDKYDIFNDFKVLENVFSENELNKPLFFSGSHTAILFDYRNNDKKSFRNIGFSHNNESAKNQIYVKNQNYADDSFIPLGEFIMSLRYFVGQFIYACKVMASYNEYYRKNIKNEDSSDIEDEARKSVLEAFDISHELDNDFMSYIASRVLAPSLPKNRDDEIEKPSKRNLYSNGIRSTSLVDRNEHYTKSKIMDNSIINTPELIMHQVCKKAKVFFISATSNVESAFSNFSFRTLKSWGVEEEKLTREESISLNQLYQDRTDNSKNIEKHVSFVGTIEFDKTLDNSEELRAIKLIHHMKNTLFSFEASDRETESLRHVFFSNLSPRIPVYALNRYYKLFQAYEEFLTHKNAYIGYAMLNKNLEDDPIVEKGMLLLNKKYLESNVELKPIKAKTFDEKNNKITELLEIGKRVFVITTYQSIARGVNPKVSIPQNKDIIKNLVLPNTHGLYDFDHMNINFMYFERETNIIPNLTEDSSDEDIFLRLFLMEALLDNGEIDRRFCDNQIFHTISRSFENKHGGGNPCIFSIRDLFSGSQSLYTTLTQACGRLSRGAMTVKDVYMCLDDDIVNYLSYTTLLNKEYKRTHEMDAIVKAILSKKEKALADSEARDFTTSEYNSLISSAKRSKASIDEFLRLKKGSMLTSAINKKWDDRRVPYKGSASGFSNSKNIDGEVAQSINKDYYVHLKEPVSSYYSNTYNNAKTLNVVKNRDRSTFMKYEVSLKAMRYLDVLKNEEIKKYFENHGYLTDVNENTVFDIVPNPIEFNNILKGSLGEIVSSVILENRDIKLSPIEDDNLKEKFDSVISGTSVYIDFKNMGLSDAKSRKEFIDYAKNKMEDVGANKVFFINMINNLSETTYEKSWEKISNEEIYIFHGLLKSEKGKRKYIVDEKAVLKIKELL